MIGFEVYGGALYAKSLDQSPQSSAIREVSRKWGEGPIGRETIPFGVCKIGYAPFRSVEPHPDKSGETLRVERMYGCKLHSQVRKLRMLAVGPRPEWQDFNAFAPPPMSVVVDVDHTTCHDAGEATGTESSSLAPTQSHAKSKKQAQRKHSVAVTCHFCGKIMQDARNLDKHHQHCAARLSVLHKTSDTIAMTTPDISPNKQPTPAPATPMKMNDTLKSTDSDEKDPLIQCEICSLSVPFTKFSNHMKRKHRLGWTEYAVHTQPQQKSKKRRTLNSCPDAPDSSFNEERIECDFCHLKFPFSEYLDHWTSHIGN